MNELVVENVGVCAMFRLVQAEQFHLLENLRQSRNNRVVGVPIVNRHEAERLNVNISEPFLIEVTEIKPARNFLHACIEPIDVNRRSNKLLAFPKKQLMLTFAEKQVEVSLVTLKCSLDFSCGLLVSYLIVAPMECNHSQDVLIIQ